MTKLDALSFEEGDDEEHRAAKVKQWTTHYLDKKTNECNEQPKPLVYLPLPLPRRREQGRPFQRQGLRGKCNVDEKAFQLFSDGTMKIHDCEQDEWKEFETTTNDYLPGMKDRGVSYGKEMYGDNGIKITKETHGKKTIALKLGNKLTIGCSHGCARTKAGAVGAVHTPPCRAARSTPTSATYKSSVGRNTRGPPMAACSTSARALISTATATSSRARQGFGPMDLDGATR